MAKQYAEGRTFMCNGRPHDPGAINRVIVKEGIESRDSILSEVEALALTEEMLDTRSFEPPTRARDDVQAALAVDRCENMFDEDVTFKFFKHAAGSKAAERATAPNINQNFNAPIGNAAGIVHGNQTYTGGSFTEDEFQRSVVEVLQLIEKSHDQIKADIGDVRAALGELMAVRASGTPEQIAKAVSERLGPASKGALVDLRESGIAVLHGLASNALFQALSALG